MTTQCPIGQRGWRGISLSAADSFRAVCRQTIDGRQKRSDPPYGRGPRWRTWSTSGSRPTSSPPARQNLVLDEAGIEDPVVFEENPGTSSRLHPLQRPKFRELVTYARPGDTMHISAMFRLVRGTGHIFDMLDVLHRDRVALRIHDGAFSAMDLTARHPRTGASP